jgi:large subunit ribosomal protein L23
MTAYDIVIKPHITEKTHKDFEAKKYVFRVAVQANKYQIKTAVEEIFKVRVKSVHTINARGKLRRRGKDSGYTPSFKKAIVQLSADSTAIKEFEGLA